jgi:hypothetical protein
MLQEMQSRFVFALNASCSWTAALESAKLQHTKKKGAELLGSPFEGTVV